MYAFLLVRSVFFARKTILKTIVICMLSGAAYLPWLLKFLLSFQRTAASWWLEAVPNARDCGRFLFGNDVLFAVWVLVVLAVLCNIGKSVKKRERLWFAAGLCAVLGLFFTGEAASYLIRPLFITRYMYDVAPVAWLMLAVGIRRCVRAGGAPRGHDVSCYATPLGRERVASDSLFKKREAAVCVLIAAVCAAVFIPEYVDTIREERRQDAATTAFLEAVSIPEDSLILTNSGPHAWTILEYYYPGTRIGESYDMTSSLVENQEDCTIISTYEFSESELEEMRLAGFTPELYYVGEVGINTKLFVYETGNEGN
jgi:Tfp pilus assembly protein PilE